jgi:hypothetical protein
MDATTSTLLFCSSLTLTYLIARTGRFALFHSAAFGLTLNAITFSAFAMTRQHFLMDATLTGLQLSVLFTTLAIGLAYVFRGLQPATPALLPIATANRRRGDVAILHSIK